MNHSVSAEQLARLWDRYVEVSKEYVAIKRATDAAERACNQARLVCEQAHEACEAAYAEEFRCGQALQHAAGQWQLASDAVFLAECGIQPGSVLSS
jgi:hypothetical protein